MNGRIETYERGKSSGCDDTDGPLRVPWDYEECTENTASAFPRIEKVIARSGRTEIVLDMTRCKYLSVRGLRHLLEWHGNLMRDGIDAHVSGLSSMLRTIFNLARLDWLISED